MAFLVADTCREEFPRGRIGSPRPEAAPCFRLMQAQVSRGPRIYLPESRRAAVPRHCRRMPCRPGVRVSLRVEAQDLWDSPYSLRVTANSRARWAQLQRVDRLAATGDRKDRAMANCCHAGSTTRAAMPRWRGLRLSGGRSAGEGPSVAASIRKPEARLPIASGAVVRVRGTQLCAS